MNGPNFRIVDPTERIVAAAVGFLEKVRDITHRGIEIS